MTDAPIGSVALIGATGNLGSVLLSTLLSRPQLTTTVLQRASSTAKPNLIQHGHKAKLVVVPDWTVADLTIALRGCDAVVAAFPLRDTEPHLRLADAACEAGVRHFIPADFGSVDARSARARELVPLFARKLAIKERLEELSERSGGRFNWTSLVNGHFFDWGLNNGFLHFYPQTRKAEILGDGNAKSSVATLARIAEATLKILERPDKTANKVLMVQSFCVSQNELLDALKRVTGDAWEADFLETEKFIQDKREKANRGDVEAVEDLVFALGVVEGNWEVQEEFAMELLGLEDEELDAVVRRALSEGK